VFDPFSARLYAADPGNSRSVVFDLGDGIIDGMPASFVLGQVALTTGAPNNDCTGALSGVVNECGLHGPWAVTMDLPQQRLFIADTANHRVLLFE
jgi:hypothetical protein